LKLTEGFDEEVNTLVGDGVVAPLPVEDVLEVTLRLERFNNHHDLEIWHFNFIDVLVAGQVRVLSNDDDAFLQQILVNSSLFFFAHEYHGGL
jgi:hypothetical protein